MPLHVQKFFKLNRTERLLFIQAYFLSLFYSFYVELIPKRIIFKRLGDKDVETSFEPIEGELNEVLQVEKAIRRVVRFLPWTTKCFARAITAKRILQHKQIPSTIYLGVAKEGSNKMIAHAWLRCGNIIVTGKEEMKKFTPIIYFS